MQAASVFLLITSVIFAASGQLLLKIGATGRHTLLEFINPLILTGVAMYVVGTVIWIFVLSSEKLVNVFPFTALTFVLIYLAGVFLLREEISQQSVLGILLVLGGLYLLYRGSVG